MKLKINGWQRLWIVVCALYLICVSVIAIAIFPSNIYTGDDNSLENQCPLFLIFRGHHYSDRRACFLIVGWSGNIIQNTYGNAVVPLQ